MSSREFVEDRPRLGVDIARVFFSQTDTQATVDVAVDLDGEKTVQQVQLTSTPMPRRGGRRWWWCCPRCKRRAGYLFPLAGLVCRRCAGLAYASQYRRVS